MQNRRAFTEILVRRFIRANRIPAVHSPQAPLAFKRRWSGSALKLFQPTYSILAVLLMVFALPTMARVREVGAIGLTVGDLDRVLRFYTNALPFELVSV